MDLPKNPFKAALKAGENQIGIWSSIPGPGPAEALASCGYDWMLIDTEHSTTDLPTVQAMLQAVAPWPCHPVVRPGWNDAVEIKRLLDAGAQSLLIPYIQSPEEAAKAIAATRYAPRGMRGMAGSTRASRWGLVENYAAKAEQEICLLLQLETVEALGHLEEIAALDGVDGIFIGPADLAASMGYPGQSNHPEVRKAACEAISRIRAAGKPAGFFTTDQSFLAEAVAAGSQFTAVDGDQGLMLRGAKARLSEWRSKISR